MEMKKRKIIPVIIASIIILLITLVYFFIYPLYREYFPKCMFHDLTGLYCPLCGIQRAVAALLHGDFSASLRNNMLFVLALPLFIYSFVIACFSALATNYTKQKIFYSSTSMKIALLIVVVFEILRNIPAYPFNLLAPL